MSDTIELPEFGLTLERAPELGDDWYAAGSRVLRVAAKFGLSHDYVNVTICRGGVTTSHATAQETVGIACERLIAQMTPDDVAAIRALGERS